MMSRRSSLRYPDGTYRPVGTDIIPAVRAVPGGGVAAHYAEHPGRRIVADVVYVAAADGRVSVPIFRTYDDATRLLSRSSVPGGTDTPFGSFRVAEPGTIRDVIPAAATGYEPAGDDDEPNRGR